MVWLDIDLEPNSWDTELNDSSLDSQGQDHCHTHYVELLALMPLMTFYFAYLTLNVIKKRQSLCASENAAKGKTMIIDLNASLTNIICDIDGKMYIIENWIGVKLEYFYSTTEVQTFFSLFKGEGWVVVND